MFFDDLWFGSILFERKVLLKRFMMEENDGSLFIELENDILDRVESIVLQKRIFYDGCCGLFSFFDINIFKRFGNEMLKIRRVNGRFFYEDVRVSDVVCYLEILLLLRDCVRVIYELLNDLIERYCYGIKVVVSVREYVQMMLEMKE